MERFKAFGDLLAKEGEPARAERVYRSAMEFFPDDTEIRSRLESVAQELEPARNAGIRERIAQIERLEEGADDEERQE